MFAVVGDSYVRRLGEFVSTYGSPNLDLNAEVRYFGRGGTSLLGAKSFIPELDAALRLPLQALFINVGSNDIGHRSPDDIATALVSAASYELTSDDTLHVIIGQVHYRSVSSYPRFARDCATVNRLVRIAVAERNDPRLSFAIIRGLKRPPPTYFRDGIHYSSPGQRLFRRGVRAAFRRTLP